MFFAALDLGSNTVSTLVRQAKSEGLVSVAKISECTRLGENLAATGNLQPAAMQRTIAAAARQLERIRCDFAPLRLTAVGTSAVRTPRTARTSGAMPPELGLCDTPAVLSGQIEAELTFRGASDAFQQRRRSSTSTRRRQHRSRLGFPAICALPQFHRWLRTLVRPLWPGDVFTEKRLKLRQQPRASCCRRSEESATPWQN